MPKTIKEILTNYIGRKYSDLDREDGVVAQDIDNALSSIRQLLLDVVEKDESIFETDKKDILFGKQCRNFVRSEIRKRIEELTKE